MEENSTPKKNVMEQIAGAIVHGRYIVYVLFIAMIVFSVLGISKVKVYSDITAFLPSDIETRRGLTIMEDEFETFASIRAMVSNVTLETAQELADKLAEVDHVYGVSFDDTTAHYAASSALFSISLDCNEESTEAEAALEAVQAVLDGYDTYISTTIGYDVSTQVMNEMGGIVAIALVVIVLVMTITSAQYPPSPIPSRSYCSWLSPSTTPSSCATGTRRNLNATATHVRRSQQHLPRRS